MMAWPEVGGARIAGRGGIGEGDLPARPEKCEAESTGDAAA
jgi:hypothetical protein